MKQNSFSTCCCRFQSGLLHCEKINTKVGANNWDEESRNLQEQEWKLCILNQSRYKSECTHGRVHRKSIWGISPQNWKSQGLIPFKLWILGLAFKLNNLLVTSKKQNHQFKCCKMSFEVFPSKEPKFLKILSRHLNIVWRAQKSKK